MLENNTPVEAKLSTHTIISFIKSQKIVEATRRLVCSFAASVVSFEF